MMKLFFVAALIMTIQGAQAACDVKISENDSKVLWTAYKTPKKVGVNGQFTKFSLKSSAATAKDEKALIEGATFAIDTTSVSTNDKARDKKIVDNFFAPGGKAIDISGKVEKFEKDTAVVKMMINGQEKEVKLSHSEDKGVHQLSGQISVIDFGLGANLAGITAACKAMHEGVTWPEVKIAVEYKTQEVCK